MPTLISNNHPNLLVDQFHLEDKLPATKSRDFGCTIFCSLAFLVSSLFTKHFFNNLFKLFFTALNNFKIIYRIDQSVEVDRISRCVLLNLLFFLCNGALK